MVRNFDHVTIAVRDLDGAQVARLTAPGVVLRNEVLNFHNRKLVFLVDPGGVTIELAQWD